MRGLDDDSYSKSILNGSAFGGFNMAYGLFWFLGSIAMGFIYQYSIRDLVVFIMALRFLALPLLMVVKYKQSENPSTPQKT